MDINQLEVFLAVAQEKSFSRAAEALHRTQPAVSQAIRRLEAELTTQECFQTLRHVWQKADFTPLAIAAWQSGRKVRRRSPASRVCPPRQSGPDP